MAYLILVRHGQSAWNAQGLWTGLIDIPLSVEGKEESKKAADAIKEIPLDAAFTSKLIRAKETLEEIKKTLGVLDLPVRENKALNERDYGEFSGKNKWEIKEKFGEEQFLKWRRGWNEPIPGGETLKDVYNRVVPYYRENILPMLENGKNVLVVAHGNSIRALVKYLENVSDADISNLDINTGEILIYMMNEQGKIIQKEKRAVNSNKV